MSESEKAETKFTEFYWGVLRVIHEGCPFIKLANLLNLVIQPEVIDIPALKEEKTPFYAVLDRYFSPDELWSTLGSTNIENLEIYKISPDFEQQSTLILGVTKDEILERLTKDPRFKRLPTNMFARPDFEYIPIRTVERKDLDLVEKIFGELATKLGGEAVLDTVGRVASLQDLMFLNRSVSPEPTSVPGLTREETKLLEAAIAYGYYVKPRRVTLADLSEKLSMPKTTLANRLRDVENRIVNNTLYVQLARRL